MKKNKSKLTGFSLIELLVVLAIFSLVMVALLQFFTNFLNLKFNAEARQKMQSEGNYLMDRIDFLIRNSITIPNICDAGKIGTDQAVLMTNLENENGGADGFIQKNGVYLVGEQVRLVQGTSNADSRSEIELTSGLYSSLPLSVTNLEFKCEENRFTGGLIVTTSFRINLVRESLGSNVKEITEDFERKTAVRNRFDWIDINYCVPIQCPI